MQFDRQLRQKSNIMLTALVDIFFLLLIFFMMTTSFVRQESLEMILPQKATAQKMSAKNETVRVEIAGANRYGLNGQWLNKEQLQVQLRTQFTQSQNRPALLQTYPDVKMNELVDVMDMIYLSGGSQIAVVRAGSVAEPVPVGQAGL